MLEPLVSGAGELWDGPCTAWLGVLLPALAAGVRLLSRRLLGRLYGFWARRCIRERFCTRSGPDGLERLLPSSTGEPQEERDGSWMEVLGLLLSRAREAWDGPDDAWLALLGLLVSVAGEPWDGADAAWLAVLGPVSSELVLEAGRGSRKVKGTAPQVRGRRGQSSAASPLGAERLCQAHPGHALPGLAWLPAPAQGHWGLCLLPVARPAQLSHSQIVVLCFKKEQRLWVPSAAQELHRSCQGLGKQTGAWL